MRSDKTYLKGRRWFASGAAPHEGHQLALALEEYVRPESDAENDDLHSAAGFFLLFAIYRRVADESFHSSRKRTHLYDDKNTLLMAWGNYQLNF